MASITASISARMKRCNSVLLLPLGYRMKRKREKPENYWRRRRRRRRREANVIFGVKIGVGIGVGMSNKVVRNQKLASASPSVSASETLFGFELKKKKDQTWMLHIQRLATSILSDPSIRTWAFPAKTEVPKIIDNITLSTLRRRFAATKAQPSMNSLGQRFKFKE